MVAFRTVTKVLISQYEDLCSFKQTNIYREINNQRMKRKIRKVLGSQRDLKSDNFIPSEVKSARLLSEGEMCMSLIKRILGGSKISSLSCGGIKLICKIIVTYLLIISMDKMHKMLQSPKFDSTTENITLVNI